MATALTACERENLKMSLATRRREHQKRMTSAGKRYRDTMTALHQAMDSQGFRTWDHDDYYHKADDYAKVNDRGSARSRQLLDRARDAFRNTAKTCGLTIA